MAEVLDIQQQWLDSFGSLLVGGKVYYGKPFTDPTLIANQIEVFANRELTTLLDNPQTIGADGRVENKPWVNERYSIQAFDSENIQRFDSQDNGQNPTTSGVTISLSNVQGLNFITADSAAGISAYDDLQEFSFVALSTNTGDMTLSVDGLTAKPIKFNFVEEIGVGFIQGGQTVKVIYSLAADTFYWMVEGRGISLLTSVAGDGNSITASGGPSTVSNVDKQLYIFNTNAANTGPVTLAIDAISAVSIKFNGSELVAGDLPINTLVIVASDNAVGVFNLVSPAPNQFLLQSKMIIPFFDVTANIPPGFVLCDGNNGTPDMVNRFPRGADATGSDIGGEAGSTSTDGHGLVEAENGLHTHNYEKTNGQAQNAQTDNDVNATLSALVATPTTPSGSGTPHAHTGNEPPYTKLLWIMKI